LHRSAVILLAKRREVRKQGGLGTAQRLQDRDAGMRRRDGNGSRGKTAHDERRDQRVNAAEHRKQQAGERNTLDQRVTHQLGDPGPARRSRGERMQ